MGFGWIGAISGRASLRTGAILRRTAKAVVMVAIFALFGMPVISAEAAARKNAAQTNEWASVPEVPGDEIFGFTSPTNLGLPTNLTAALGSVAAIMAATIPNRNLATPSRTIGGSVHRLSAPGITYAMSAALPIPAPAPLTAFHSNCNTGCYGEVRETRSRFLWRSSHAGRVSTARLVFALTRITPISSF
jgi:hypothetical protein